MKKAIVLLLVLLLFAGCTQQGDVQQNDPKSEVQTPEAETSGEEEKDSKETPEAQTEEKAKPEVGSRVGNLAPDFELKTLEGDTIKLSDLRGKPVHLVFWSVDCVYCMKELPHVEKLYQENKDNYQVLALNVTIQDGMKRFQETVEDKGFTFPNLALDDDNGGLDVLQSYGVRGIPHNVFIDKEGVIHMVTPGMMDHGAQERVIKELIAQ